MAGASMEIRVFSFWLFTSCPHVPVQAQDAESSGFLALALLLGVVANEAIDQQQLRSDDVLGGQNAARVSGHGYLGLIQRAVEYLDGAGMRLVYCALQIRGEVRIKTQTGLGLIKRGLGTHG